MKKAILSTLSVLTLLSACGGSDAPVDTEAENADAVAESEFDQQLSDEEANAALDALDAEEVAPVTE